MSAKYKLTYFNGRGLAEGSRYLLAVAGVEYEDFRFPVQRNADGTYVRPEFDAAKSTFTWEQVPVLEVDGHAISQSRAIERFLAKRFNLFGSNDIEAADIDSVSEEISDVQKAYFRAMAKDDAAKAAGQTAEADKTFSHKFATEEVPNFLRLFERFLTNHNSTGHFVGGRLSLADIQFFTFATNPHIKVDLTNYPKCAAVVKTVGENDKIKAWIAKRPETMF